MISRVLAWIATAAGLVLIVVLATGGFRFEAGPLRVSAHSVTTPLLLIAAAGIALARLGAARALDALSSIFTRVTAHAAAIAVIGAAAIAGIGVGFGTYSASASDPSAYVSHSALIDAGRLSLDEPLARAVDWHEATW